MKVITIEQLKNILKTNSCMIDEEGEFYYGEEIYIAIKRWQEALGFSITLDAEINEVYVDDLTIFI